MPLKESPGVSSDQYSLSCFLLSICWARKCFSVGTNPTVPPKKRKKTSQETVYLISTQSVFRKTKQNKKPKEMKTIRTLLEKSSWKHAWGKEKSKDYRKKRCPGSLQSACGRILVSRKSLINKFMCSFIHSQMTAGHQCCATRDTMVNKSRRAYLSGSLHILQGSRQKINTTVLDSDKHLQTK